MPESHGSPDHSNLEIIISAHSKFARTEWCGAVSMLVINVGDIMCRWHIWDFRNDIDRFVHQHLKDVTKILSYVNNTKVISLSSSRKQNDVTDCWPKLPSKVHHDEVIVKSKSS